MAGAVGYAHRQGVIHRDLKPGNVLVEEGGRVVLTDFGLARANHLNASLTRSSQLLGTPHYMAPEQIEKNGQAPSARTDVYSLGVILYEILAGTVPFRGTTPAGLLGRIVQDDPVPPRKMSPSTPRDLEGICLKALEKDPARRYPDGHAFAEELGRARRGEPILARPASTSYRLRKRIVRHGTVSATIALATLGLAILGMVLARQVGSARENARLQETLKPIMALLRETRPLLYVPNLDLRETYSRVEEALDRLTRIVGKPAHANNPEALALLGIGLDFVGSLREAEEVLVRATALNPSDPWARLTLAKIYLQRAQVEFITGRGPHSGKTKDRRSTLAHWSQKVAHLLERGDLSGSGSNSIDGCVLEAYRFLADSQLEEARRICEEGIQKFKEEIGREEFHCILAWLSQGRDRVESYERAILIRPHYPWALLMKGAARHSELGDVEGAIEDYRKAIGLNPRIPELFENLGFALTTKGAYDEAIATLNEAIRLNPQSAAAYNNRATAYFSKGDRDAGMADLRQVLRINPSLCEAHANLGLAWTQDGEYAKAIESFTKALSLNPDWSEVLTARGAAFARMGDQNQAMSDFDEAIRSGPGYPPAYMNRATFWMKRQEWDKAMADYSRALEVAPQDWGHRKDAERALERARAKKAFVVEDF
jgi:tetratricopeptide (TPR) repeat protein